MQKFNAWRKWSSAIHFFFSTNSWCMMAICPVGPPKLMNPSFSQNLKASRKEGWGVGSVTLFADDLQTIKKTLGIGLGPQADFAWLPKGRVLRFQNLLAIIKALDPVVFHGH